MAIQELEIPITTLEQSQKVVLYDIPWRDYLRLLQMFDGRHIRLTYNRGTLEIMTLSAEHENYTALLDRLISVLAEEVGWNMGSFGSVTIKRSIEEKGLEPDGCYWINNEAKVRGMKRFDIRRDPAPDLVLEIDVTSSSLDRLGIYAVFNVPEVWRYDGQTLSSLWLADNGEYEAHEYCRVLPPLAIAEVAPYVAMGLSQGETHMMRQFRAWVRTRVAEDWK